MNNFAKEAEINNPR